MKAFYEKQRDDDDELNFNDDGRFAFPLHFHESIEVFVLLKGEYNIFLNGSNIFVKGGQTVIIDSYDMHEYVGNNENVQGFVILIPSRLQAPLRDLKKNRILSSPLIEDNKLTEELNKVYTDYIKPAPTKRIREYATLLFLSTLCERLEFSGDKQSNELGLIRKVLEYINENYKEKLSLPVIAKNFGYTEEHISRTFHRYLKTSLPSYVNSLRLKAVNIELEKGEKKLYEIVFESGFNSLQTYYRVKKEAESIKN